MKKNLIKVFGKKVLESNNSNGGEVNTPLIKTQNTETYKCGLEKNIPSSLNEGDLIIIEDYFDYGSDNIEPSLIKNFKNESQLLREEYPSAATSINTLEDQNPTNSFNTIEEDILYTNITTQSESVATSINTIENQGGTLTRELLDAVNIMDTKKIEYLTARFKESDAIAGYIENAFIQTDNIADFFLNSTVSGNYDASSTINISRDILFHYIPNKDNIPLLENVYNLVRDVVICPDKEFDTGRLLEIVEEFKSRHGDSSIELINNHCYKLLPKAAQFNNDFFELFPQATLVLKLLFAAGLVYSMHNCTTSKLYNNFDDAGAKEFANYSKLSAIGIYLESPLKELTGFIYPICNNNFVQNNVNVQKLLLKNNDQELDIGYVNTHLFTYLFTSEYFRRQYTSLLKITGRIGHPHPLFKNIGDPKEPIQVTHEIEETQQALKRYFHDEDEIPNFDKLGLKNYELLKNSNFLGKIIFQGLLDPSTIASIAKMLMGVIS